MGVLYILLFIQGIMGEMVLYQPQDIISMNVNGTAVIICESKSNLDTKTKIFWFYKKWSSGDWALVKSCLTDDTHKYVCKHERYVTSLEIYNVQVNDSGIYYCAQLFSVMTMKFGNGTNLRVGDRSTCRSSIYILGPLQLNYPHSSLHLACVVHATRNTVHLYWNISGRYHKGQIVSKEESDGSWTVMNFISLPKENRSHGQKVTCEAWLQSSPISVHWEIPGQGDLNRSVASICQNFWIPMVTAGALLMLMLSVHLIRTHRDKKMPGLKGKNTVLKDNLIYTELKINHRTRCNQPAQ